jgi:carboxyl-terminal processing protease
MKLAILTTLALVSGPAPLQAAPSLADGKRLISLEQLSWAVLEITRSYVDPKRMDPMEMLKQSLRGVENAIPDLLVDEAGLPKKVVLNLGERSWNGDTSQVRSVWEMYIVLRGALGFVGRNLPVGVKASDVELAAVNGLLQSLDPHSVMFSPRAYEEMRMSTQGQFGGLGIVIGTRDGWLTVIAPIAGTPASRAGIRARDRIVQINEETTQNMGLDQAVSRLRGEPNSKVTIYIKRAGRDAKMKKVLTRAIIKVRSVTSSVLNDGIGYLRIKSFRENTTDDAVEQLAKLRQRGATKGLVLDLRDNPGGLLEQAVSISDLFLPRGVIVTTVGMAGQVRESRHAHAAGTLAKLPVVVLMSGGSASASEIVAGALRNHKRALLLGNVSFGKGSVQTIIPYRPRRTEADGSALKLTIAQYLTPGDISIQGIGVAPDILLDPVSIVEEEVTLKQRKTTKEADLSHHLENERAKQQTERTSVRVLDTQAAVEMDEQTRRESAGEFHNDLPIAIAAELLSKAGDFRADRFYKQATPVLAEVERREEGRIVTALRGAGINWTRAAKKTGGGDGEITLALPTSVQPGETARLTVRVHNRGDAPLSRLVVRSESELSLLDGREWIFGRVEAGATAERTVEIEIPLTLQPRRDDIRFDVRAEGGSVRTVPKAQIVVASSVRPTLRYRVSLDDGNDGLAAVGETFQVRVMVASDDADAEGVLVSLRSDNGPRVNLESGRASRERLKPGTNWKSTLKFSVRSSDRPLEFDLNVGATEQGVWTTEKIKIPRANARATVSACKGPVQASVGQAPIRAGAVDRAALLGQLDPGVSLPCLGRVGGFFRVDLGDQVVGFVRESQAVLGRAGLPVKGWISGRTPPKIDLQPVLEVSGTSLRLKAEAHNDGPLRSVVVYSGRKKVFIAHAGGNRVAINQEIKLEPGYNLITVHAREDTSYGGSKSFWVLRRQGWKKGESVAAHGKAK